MGAACRRREPTTHGLLPARFHMVPCARRKFNIGFMTDHDDKLRVGKGLWHARFYKTRSIAAAAVESGKVLVNGARVKPAKSLKAGDELFVRVPGADYTVLVQALSDRRGPAT